MSYEVAQTIAQQIGNMTFAMLGSKGTVVAGEKHLRFGVKGSRKVSCLLVRLESSDLYTVEAYKGKGVNMHKVTECTDVHVESLHTTIEMLTGLRTRL